MLYIIEWIVIVGLEACMFETTDVLLLLLFVAVFYIYNELRVTRQRFFNIDRKLDCLLEEKGILFDKQTYVPKDVLVAFNLGHKLKAIRLYRQHTGASLKQAHELINKLESN